MDRGGESLVIVDPLTAPPRRAWIPAAPPVGPEPSSASRAASDLTAARSALQQARLVRAQALVEVKLGRWSLDRLIDEAGTRPGHPLRRLKLSAVLGAQTGWGRGRVQRTLTQVRERCGEPERPFTEMTVSWLLDRRAGGRRYLAWIDAATPKTTPWTGWPFTPQPRTLGEVA